MDDPALLEEEAVPAVLASEQELYSGVQDVHVHCLGDVGLGLGKAPQHKRRQPIPRQKQTDTHSKISSTQMRSDCPATKTNGHTLEKLLNTNAFKLSRDRNKRTQHHTMAKLRNTNAVRLSDDRNKFTYTAKAPQHKCRQTVPRQKQMYTHSHNGKAPQHKRRQPVPRQKHMYTQSQGKAIGLIVAPEKPTDLLTSIRTQKRFKRKLIFNKTLTQL